jgi:hypothetical protein
MNIEYVILYKSSSKDFFSKSFPVEALSPEAALAAFAQEHPNSTFLVLYDKSIQDFIPGSTE